MSRCTDIKANPISLSYPVAFRKQDYRRLSVKMVRSSVTVDTGSVVKTLRRKCVIGKKCLLHRTSDNNAEEGRAAVGICMHFTCQTLKSDFAVSFSTSSPK